MADLTHNGTTYTSLRAACAASNVDYYRVRRRVAQGWTLTDAINAPIYARKPLGPAASALEAMFNAYSGAQIGAERAAVIAITRIGAVYLKEHPHADEP